MGFYNRHLLPLLIEYGMRAEPVRRQRQKIVPLATGRVLEVGIGSGHNLAFYDPAKVERVIGLDPSAELRVRAEERVGEVAFPVEFIGREAEDIPLADASVDTVVVTYTLCTIPDVERALASMRRVLKPGGKLFYCEHGRAPDISVRKWQDRLNPLWGLVSGGCNINRNVPKLLEDAGLQVHEIDTIYLPGPRPFTFNYWGRASKS